VNTIPSGFVANGGDCTPVEALTATRPEWADALDELRADLVGRMDAMHVELEASVSAAVAAVAPPGVQPCEDAAALSAKLDEIRAMFESRLTVLESASSLDVTQSTRFGSTEQIATLADRLARLEREVDARFAVCNAGLERLSGDMRGQSDASEAKNSDLEQRLQRLMSKVDATLEPPRFSRSPPPTGARGGEQPVAAGVAGAVPAAAAAIAGISATAAANIMVPASPPASLASFGSMRSAAGMRCGRQSCPTLLNSMLTRSSSDFAKTEPLLEAPADDSDPTATLHALREENLRLREANMTWRELSLRSAPIEPTALDLSSVSSAGRPPPQVLTASGAVPVSVPPQASPAIGTAVGVGAAMHLRQLVPTTTVVRFRSAGVPTCAHAQQAQPAWVLRPTSRAPSP